MKKLILVLIILCLQVGAFAQTHFTFSGTILGGSGIKASLYYINSDGKTISNDYPLKNGKFIFEGEINGPQYVLFTVFKKKHFENELNDTAFFLEPGSITTTACGYGHIHDLKIIGSKTQEESVALQKKLDRGDSKHDIEYRQYIISHPTSYVGVFWLNMYASKWPLNTVKAIYSKFSPAVKNCMYGRQIQSKIMAIENSVINKEAFNFSTVELNGKPIRLSDFKGKYVLLDFWASWCVPCRASMPHMVKLYKKYNKAGLEIIGVSDDDTDPKAWKKAMKKDGTGIWRNVLDGAVFTKDPIDKSPSISNEFAIHSIPSKILIDKNGIIIGRYDENTAPLDKKLAEIFD